MKTFLTLLGIVFMASDLVAATPQPAMRSVVERALDRSLEQSMQLYAEMKNHPGRPRREAGDLQAALVDQRILPRNALASV